MPGPPINSQSCQHNHCQHHSISFLRCQSDGHCGQEDSIHPHGSGSPHPLGRWAEHCILPEWPGRAPRELCVHMFVQRAKFEVRKLERKVYFSGQGERATWKELALPAVRFVSNIWIKNMAPTHPYPLKPELSLPILNSQASCSSSRPDISPTCV